MLIERHNRGRIIGGEAEVCPDTKMDRLSFVANRADLWRTTLVQSKVEFSSRVRMSHLERSRVGSQDSPVEIGHSHLMESDFFGGTALGCRINHSTISGSPYFRGSGNGILIVNSLIRDQVRIEGEVVVIGVVLEKQMRLVRGVWSRPPRYLHLEEDGIEMGVTESVNGFATIGCKEKSMAKWIKKRKLWQKIGRWSDEMTELVRRTFEQWMDEKLETN